MKEIYLVVRRDSKTGNDDICFAVDGTRKQAGERMVEYVTANDIDTERFLVYFKVVNCYCN